MKKFTEAPSKLLPVVKLFLLQMLRERRKRMVVCWSQAPVNAIGGPEHAIRSTGDSESPLRNVWTRIVVVEEDFLLFPTTTRPNCLQ